MPGESPPQVSLLLWPGAAGEQRRDSVCGAGRAAAAAGSGTERGVGEDERVADTAHQHRSHHEQLAVNPEYTKFPIIIVI